MGFVLPSIITSEFFSFYRKRVYLRGEIWITREQAELSIDNLESLIQQDVRAAYIELNVTKEQIAATEATRILQKGKMTAEIEKNRVGKSTTLLVAQAQRDLLESQIAETQAVANYQKALVNLYRLEGTLLEYNDISVLHEG